MNGCERVLREFLFIYARWTLGTYARLSSRRRNLPEEARMVIRTSDRITEIIAEVAAALGRVATLVTLGARPVVGTGVRVGR